MIFIVISFLTGTFAELIIILTIVLIHELGHYFVARRFNWRIKSIMLWVFGGVMNTEEHGNRPLHEEALVVIAGPLQNVFIYGLIYLLSLNNLLPTSILELAFYYNTAILLFNLLPIWPLDGGKLLFIILSSLLPYRKAYHFVIIFSIILSLFILIVQLIFFDFTLSVFFIMIFLLMENRTEWKHRFFVFIRFLLNRYEGNTSVKSIQPLVVSHQVTLMEVFKRFKRDKKHSIFITFPNNKREFIDEADCLHCYFYEKEYNKKVGEIVDKII